MFKRILTLTVLVLISSLSFSQLSKDEKKEWKKKMKAAGIEGFKNTTEERDEAKAQVSTLTTENETLTNKTSQLQGQVDELESDVADYKKAAKESADKLTEAEAKLDSLGAGAPPNGVVFKVQIGAYRKFDLTQYFNNHKNFGGEIDDDGTMKYTMGIFTSYADAQTFKKLMREMGVRGAWIVAYKHGRRIEMQQALNEAN